MATLVNMKAFKIESAGPRMWQLTIICVMVTVLFISYAIAMAGPSENIIPGIVEDVPGHYSGQANFRAVRVVFQKSAEDWQPFPSRCPDQECLRTITSRYPAKMTWTLTFDGRNLGQVSARTPGKFDYYADVGLQEITSTSAIPTISKRSTEYSGFLGAPVYRPLVANSRPYFNDPELWKPARPTTESLIALRQQFRKRFSAVSNCQTPYENVPRPWQYRDDAIKLLSAYSSKNQWSVVQLQLTGYRCDGPADDAFITQWFVIDPGKTINSLGKGMWLVDAGDYDNDGKSELVFSVGGYNSGGYRIFYDDFKRSATFAVRYH